jgi:uncharacterized membrane protein
MNARGLVLALALFAVIAGTVARLDGLNRKLFWQDETFSMMRISGHVERDLYGIFDGRVHTAGSIVAIERLVPGRGIGATLSSLSDEPQRGPLYYAVARVWAGAFGDEVGRMRLLSVLLGVAGIGFAFLLGRRIAGGTLGGAILAGLVAIAPVEVRFSGQVREYVAIADATLASAWLLLRAIERGSALRWICYTASLLVGLFVSPLMVTIVAAHCVAVVVGARTPRKQLFAWCASAGVACIAFAPWLAWSLAAAPAHARDISWLTSAYGPSALATKWAFNVGVDFFDAEVARRFFAIALVPIGVIVVLAIAGALRRGDDLFCRTLALATTFAAVALVVGVDLLRHASYESVTRYQMTTWVGIDVLVAMLLARAVASERRVLRTAGVASFAFLIACGTFCALFDRSYALWWDNNEHIDESRVAATIARGGTDTLIVADGNGTAQYVLVLARYVPPETKMLLFHGTLPVLPAVGGRIYAFVPDSATIDQLRRLRDFTLQNVSPSLIVAIPTLRSSTDGGAYAARPDNTLWQIHKSRL